MPYLLCFPLSAQAASLFLHLCCSFVFRSTEYLTLNLFEVVGLREGRLAALVEVALHGHLGDLNSGLLDMFNGGSCGLRILEVSGTVARNV